MKDINIHTSHPTQDVADSISDKIVLARLFFSIVVALATLTTVASPKLLVTLCRIFILTGRDDADES